MSESITPQIPPYVIQGASPNTLKIAGYLRAQPMGTFIEYDVFRRMVGDKYKQYLQSARRMVLREDHQVWGAVSGKGVKRLDDSQIVGLFDHYRDRIKKTSFRAKRAVSAANFDELDEADKVLSNAAQAYLGTIYLFSRTKSRERLVAHTTKVGEIDKKEFLKLFL